MQTANYKKTATRLITAIDKFVVKNLQVLVEEVIFDRFRVGDLLVAASTCKYF